MYRTGDISLIFAHTEVSFLNCYKLFCRWHNRDVNKDDDGRSSSPTHQPIQEVRSVIKEWCDLVSMELRHHGQYRN